MNNQKPIYEHDCDRCKFLGVFNNQDLYFCNQQFGDPKYWTLISRYGKDGDYCSGGWKSNLPQMVEAHKRAVAAGYIKEGEYAQ